MVVMQQTCDCCKPGCHFETCSLAQIIISQLDPDNGMAPNRQQGTILTNDGLVYVCVHTSVGPINFCKHRTIQHHILRKKAHWPHKIQLWSAGNLVTIIATVTLELSLKKVRNSPCHRKSKCTWSAVWFPSSWWSYAARHHNEYRTCRQCPPFSSAWPVDRHGKIWQHGILPHYRSTSTRTSFKWIFSHL